MGQQNSKNPEKHHETPQINFLNIASGSGLSIPSQRRTPENSQLPPVWNTIFRWPFGGENVSIAGTFTNWKNPIPLTKVGNEFNIILSLPAGIHKYKFIVDGEWKFSLLDPTCLDENGNVNNIIDTTHYNPKISEAIGMGSGSISGSGNNFPAQQVAIKTPIQESKKAELSPRNKQVFNDFDFDTEAQATPPHLLDIYFVNEKVKKIKEVWRREEINDDHKNSFTEGVFRGFESFNAISPPTHVVLNHMGAKNQDYFERNQVLVLTERFKGKYATIKFYTTR